MPLQGLFDPMIVHHLEEDFQAGAIEQAFTLRISVLERFIQLLLEVFALLITALGFGLVQALRE